MRLEEIFGLVMYTAVIQGEAIEMNYLPKTVFIKENKTISA